jgi:hypothetical protein
MKMETVCFSKHWYLPVGLHGAKTQKNKIVILTAMKTSNLGLIAASDHKLTRFCIKSIVFLGKI